MSASGSRPIRTSPSPFVGAIQPITESDDQLRVILQEAQLPPLLPSLAYLTGDLSLLKAHLRPDPLLLGEPQAGLTPEQQAEIRELAVGALARYRDGGCVPAPAPSDADLQQIMEFSVGGAEMDAYLPLLEEELAHEGVDRRAPQWTLSGLRSDLDFSVIIIGAGMSGLLTAYRLQQVGIPFTIIEKTDDVGGTWHDNVYPGCRVDNPNHNYSYSFAQRHDWPFHYSTQDVLHRYFRDIAETFDLRKHVRFNTEVTSASWNDDTLTWTVDIRNADGSTESLTSNAVVSATGQLSLPLYPNIPGVGTFAGPTFHSARWNPEVELAGKKVLVIGTGGSALQFLPEVAKVAGELVIFQRTPGWLYPTPDYHDEVESGLKWMYGHVPFYSEFNRFFIFWTMGDGALENVRVQDGWAENGSAVSEVNEVMRGLLVDYLKAEFEDRPDLLEKVIPNYPPGAKRMIRDNGIWARTLKRDNVTLETGRIAGIDASGVQMESGDRYDADVIIYATGFQASKFLTPMKVSGSGGRDLHGQWAGDARAYLGVTVPGFPNLFCLYGPNTNIVINGSIIYFSECGVRYIIGLLGMMLGRGAKALDVRKDIHDDFNEKVDQENRRMAWGWSDVSAWYKNEFGRVSQNWPFTLLEYWQRTGSPNVDDYEFLP